MTTPTIFIQKAGLARLWNVTSARVSQLCKDMQPEAYRDEGVALVPLLEARPTVLPEDRFDTVIARWGFAVADEMKIDAMAAVKDQAVWALNSAVTARSNPTFRKPKTSPSEASDVRHDAMATLRMEKLRAEIEGRNLKTLRESGELVRRSDVERDLKAAGSVVQQSLSMLPSRISELVPPEHRAEAMQRVEDAIERALYAVITSLGGDGGEED